MHMHQCAQSCTMVCFTLVECSLPSCVSWTILSGKTHLHMFPLLRLFCQTMEFLHRPKTRKNKVSLLLPTDGRVAVPSSLVFAVPLSLRQKAARTFVHCIIQGPCA